MLLLKDGRSEAEADALVEALGTDYRMVALSEADWVMLDYAIKLTHTPAAMTADDVVRLKKAGFNDQAVHDICAIAAYFAFVNRIADGLGVELEPRFLTPGS